MVRMNQYKCLDNVISKLKISVEKYIISDKNGEYKSHCAEICLESEISNYCHIHLNLMKKTER